MPRRAAKKAKGDKKAKAPAGTQPAQTSAPTVETEATPETRVQGGADGQQAAETQKADKPKRTRAKKEPKEKRMSGLDAAAKVLEESGTADDRQGDGRGGRGQGLLEVARRQDALGHDLQFAIIREIKAKGAEARFSKADRGKFARKG